MDDLTVTGAVQGTDYATKERTGPWCLDHKSVYCTHVQAFINSRLDVTDIQRAILGEHAPGAIYMTVPVFPSWSVWEYLYYEVHTLDAIGPVGAMHPLGIQAHKELAGIKRLMPGESARDLGVTLRQQFEDDLEEFMEHMSQAAVAKLTRCKSPGHSFRYQQIASKVVTPESIQAAYSGSGDVEMVYGMVYSYMRYDRCLFCNVNETCRDAVRVNPNLSEFFPSTSTPTDFDDLVPS